MNCRWMDQLTGFCRNRNLLAVFTFVQIGVSRLTHSEIKIYTGFDRARRGGSGALYLQSAIAGLNSGLRPLVFSMSWGKRC